MINFFTNPKNLTLNTQANPQILLQQFQRLAGEDNFSSRLKNTYSFIGECVGKVDGSDMRVTYIWAVHNPAELSMHINVEPAPAGGSVIHTRSTISIFGKLFVIILICSFFADLWVMFTVHAVPGGGTPRMIPTATFLVAFVLLRLFALRGQDKMEKFLHKVINTAEAEQRGEKVF